MFAFTAHSAQQVTVFARILRKGLTLIVTRMESLDKNRIEAAKQKLREKLSFSYVSQLPAYKNITEQQYQQLIENIEVLSLLLLATFLNPKL